MKAHTTYYIWLASLALLLQSACWLGAQEGDDPVDSLRKVAEEAGFRVDLNVLEDPQIKAEQESQIRIQPFNLQPAADGPDLPPEQKFARAAAAAGLEYYRAPDGIFYVEPAGKMGSEILSLPPEVNAQEAKALCAATDALDPRFSFSIASDKSGGAKVFLRGTEKYRAVVKEQIAEFFVSKALSDASRKREAGWVTQTIDLPGVSMVDKLVRLPESASRYSAPILVPGVESQIESILADRTLSTTGGSIDRLSASLSELTGERPPSLGSNLVVGRSADGSQLEITGRAGDVDRAIEKIKKNVDRPKLVEITVAIVDVDIDATLLWRSGYLAATGSDVRSAQREAAGLPVDSQAAASTQRSGRFGFGSRPGFVSPVDGANKTLSSSLAEGAGLNLTTLIQGESFRILNQFQALETAGKARMLTRPSVVTSSGNPALIIEQKNAFVTVSGIDVASLFEIKAGVLMKVVPTIITNADGKTTRIALSVRIEDGTIQDVSPVIGAEETPDEPSIIGKITRGSRIDTSAILFDGQGMLIGGRYREIDGDAEFRVPLVGRLPVLGLPFKNMDKGKARVQRLFFLTPKIVDPDSLPDVPPVGVEDIVAEASALPTSAPVEASAALFGLEGDAASAPQTDLTAPAESGRRRRFLPRLRKKVEAQRSSQY